MKVSIWKCSDQRLWQKAFLLMFSIVVNMRARRLLITITLREKFVEVQDDLL